MTRQQDEPLQQERLTKRMEHLEQERLRKRREHWGQNAPLSMEDNSQQEQLRIAMQEHERKRMDEARAARSQIAKRTMHAGAKKATQEVQEKTKRTRSEQLIRGWGQESTMFCNIRM